jgi:hypothetical protein
MMSRAANYLDMSKNTPVPMLCLYHLKKGTEEQFLPLPGVAHQMPEVMQIWEPMGPLTENMEFLQVEPVR